MNALLRLDWEKILAFLTCVTMGGLALRWIYRTADFVERMRTNHLPHILSDLARNNRLLVKICHRLGIKDEDED